jgi:hypothetical protein
VKPWYKLLDLKFVTTVAMDSGCHHNLSKHAILSTLVQVLSDELAKLEILKDTFRQNRYSNHQIHRALNPSARIALP